MGRTNFDDFQLEPDEFDPYGSERDDDGGFMGLAVLALVAGVGAALLFAPVEGARARKAVGGRLRDLRGGAGAALDRVQREWRAGESRRRRQERRTAAVVGVAVGAGLAALLVPASGPDTRRFISDTLRRKAGGGEPSGTGERVVREPEADPELQGDAGQQAGDGLEADLEGETNPAPRSKPRRARKPRRAEPESESS